MTIDLQTLRDELRFALGVEEDDDGWENDPIDLLLNRAYWALLAKFPFRSIESTVNFNMEVGSNLYIMPTPFDALKQISIIDPDSNRSIKLKRMTPVEYANVYVAGSNAYAIPEKYFRENAAAKVWPTPDKAYACTLKYTTILAELEDPTDEPGVPHDWREILLFGAQWRGYYRLGDIVRGERMKKLDATMINDAVPVEAKEEGDSSEAGVEYLRNDYDGRD